MVDAFHRDLAKRLPPPLRRVHLRSGNADGAKPFDAVIFTATDKLRTVCEAVAAREGAIVSVQGFARGSNILLERHVERSLSVNTAAAGGNASLMTIG